MKVFISILFYVLLFHAPTTIAASPFINTPGIEQKKKVKIKTSNSGIFEFPNIGELFVLSIYLPEGWHTYWINPGQAGMAPRLTWKTPPGLSLGEIQLPIPQRIVENGIITFGYYDSLTLIVPIQREFGIRGQIKGDIQLLLCKDECIVIHCSTTIDIPDTLVKKRKSEIFSNFPPSDSVDPGFFTVTDSSVILALKNSFPKENSPIAEDIFPITQNIFDITTKPIFRFRGNFLIVEIKRALIQQQIPQHIQGILVINRQKKKVLKFRAKYRSGHF